MDVEQKAKGGTNGNPKLGSVCRSVSFFVYSLLDCLTLLSISVQSVICQDLVPAGKR